MKISNKDSKSIVFVVDALNTDHLHFIRKNKIKTVVCNENKILSEINDIKIVNSELYRIEGTWLTYSYNQNIVKNLWNKHSKYFTIKEINLLPMVLKLMYWTNYKSGYLQACINAQFSGFKIINRNEFIKGKRLKFLLKYMFIYCKNSLHFIRNRTIKNQSLSEKFEYGILVNNTLELNLYKYVIQCLKEKKIIIFHYGNIDFKTIKLNLDGIELFNLSNFELCSKQRFFNPLFLSKESLFVSNLLFEDWNLIGSEIARLELIKSSGIRKLLINVGENLPMRNLMKPVFGESIQVYNTMNGLKSGEAHDADINFDYWFVWDNFMRDLLHTKCNIPLKKLLVSGHLSEDQIANYQYKNSFNFNLETIKNKKVISIFSVQGYRKEKLDAFDVLYSFIKDNNDYFLIVKPHPLEKNSDYIRPDSSIKNVYFIPENLKNSKEGLYDQLYLSDLSIVFGSTVALESTWMGVPCLSFEYKEQSLIYNIQANSIKHVKSKNELMDQIKNYAFKKDKQTVENHNVSQIIAESLLN